MSDNLPGYIIIAAVIGGVGWAVMRFAAMPKQTCLYPHCGASRSHCLPVCPHWRDEYSDEHLGV